MAAHFQSHCSYTHLHPQTCSHRQINKFSLCIPVPLLHLPIQLIHLYTLTSVTHYCTPVHNQHTLALKSLKFHNHSFTNNIVNTHNTLRTLNICLHSDYTHSNGHTNAYMSYNLIHNNSYTHTHVKTTRIQSYTHL